MNTVMIVCCILFLLIFILISYGTVDEVFEKGGFESEYFYKKDIITKIIICVIYFPAYIIIRFIITIVSFILIFALVILLYFSPFIAYKYDYISGQSALIITIIIIIVGGIVKIIAMVINEFTYNDIDNKNNDIGSSKPSGTKTMYDAQGNITGYIEK